MNDDKYDFGVKYSKNIFFIPTSKSDTAIYYQKHSHFFIYCFGLAVGEQNVNAGPQTEARRILPLPPQVSSKTWNETLLKQQTGAAKPRLSNLKILLACGFRKCL